MRFSSLLTLVCSIAALVLALLCLFAGSSRTFLQSADIMTLNVSRIGQGDFFNTTAEEDDNFLDDLFNTAQEAANDLIGSAADAIADRLNISDFYAVHVMNYCEGEFEPNATDRDASKNTTHCSGRNALFHFDPAAIIEEHLPGDITLEDLHWPDEIDDAVHAIRAASIAMFVFWCVGIAFAGFAIIGAAVSSFTDGRLTACGVFVCSVISFLSLGIAAAIATAIMAKATDAINKYGEDIGVSATKGTTFLGLAWGAVAAMLVAMIVSIAQVCVGRREKSYKHTPSKI
jgi:hypothetical protein